jgi:hypothetical protein
MKLSCWVPPTVARNMAARRDARSPGRLSFARRCIIRARLRAARDPVDEHARDDADSALDLGARWWCRDFAMRWAVTGAPQGLEEEVAFVLGAAHRRPQAGG